MTRAEWIVLAVMAGCFCLHRVLLRLVDAVMEWLDSWNPHTRYVNANVCCDGSGC